MKKGMKILVGIFLVTLLLTGCSKNSNEKETQQKNDIKEVQVLEFYPSSLAFVYDGEVYAKVYGSTPELDNIFGTGTYETLINTINDKYQEFNLDGLKVLNASNENFKGLKLNVSDVKNVYSYAYGQALSTNYGLIILKNDGNLYSISLYSLINGKTDVTPISNLSNIISLKTKASEGLSGGLHTYAIDKDNQEYDLDNYISKDYKTW